MASVYLPWFCADVRLFPEPIRYSAAVSSRVADRGWKDNFGDLPAAAPRVDGGQRKVTGRAGSWVAARKLRRRDRALLLAGQAAAHRDERPLGSRNLRNSDKDSSTFSTQLANLLNLFLENYQQIAKQLDEVLLKV